MRERFIVPVLVAAFVCLSVPAAAGPIFLTGHDPDFHAQLEAGAKNLLRIGVEFAAGGAVTSTNKLLWVESSISVPGGHLRGWHGLVDIGLVNGTDFDVVTGAQFAAADLSQYAAIGVASSFGGTLSAAELDALVLRNADIKAFINGGKGLFASAECTNGVEPRQLRSESAGTVCECTVLVSAGDGHVDRGYPIVHGDAVRRKPRARWLRRRVTHAQRLRRDRGIERRRFRFERQCGDARRQRARRRHRFQSDTRADDVRAVHDCARGSCTRSKALSGKIRHGPSHRPG